MGRFAGAMALMIAIWVGLPLWALVLQSVEMPEVTRWLYYLPHLALILAAALSRFAQYWSVALMTAIMTDMAHSLPRIDLGFWAWAFLAIQAVFAAGSARDSKLQSARRPWINVAFLISMTVLVLYGEYFGFANGTAAIARGESGIYDSWRINSRMEPPAVPTGWMTIRPSARWIEGR